MPRRQRPPSQREVPRHWGGKLANPANAKTAGEQVIAGPMAMILEAMGALVDQVAPQSEPQDVELPNPEGWAGTDPRIKAQRLGLPMRK